jgi:hypothetical protein
MEKNKKKFWCTLERSHEKLRMMFDNSADSSLTPPEYNPGLCLQNFWSHSRNILYAYPKHDIHIRNIIYKK